MSDLTENQTKLSVFDHPRLSEYDRLVYPVVSRRAGGLSLGINLNPEKSCSYNCVYCQVDRTIKIEHLKLDLEQILSELDYWLKIIQKEGGRFQDQELKDISIAGDGEPTLKKILPNLIIRLIKKKEEYGLRNVKLILFTNGTNLTRPDLLDTFDSFTRNNGEIWFKLDSWDEAGYQKINRSSTPYAKLISNLVLVGNRYPVVLQSCFFSTNNQKVTPSGFQGYVQLINRLMGDGVKIKQIQVYTTARKPAESFVTPLSDVEMDDLHGYLSQRIDCEIMTTYAGGKKSS
ncbi:radical SAM protein [bacterium]|nr:radical SAM protein [bacterium]